MTTSATTLPGKPGPARTHWLRQLHYVRSALASILFLMPVMLVIAPSPYRALGIIYGAAWLIVMAPSSATYLYLITDAVLLLRHRRPVLLPLFLYVKALNPTTPEIPTAVRSLARISFVANPLANLALVSVNLAYAWRCDMLNELWVEAKTKAKIAQTSTERSMVMRVPDIEFAEPVIEYSEAACVCYG